MAQVKTCGMVKTIEIEQSAAKSLLFERFQFTDYKIMGH